MCCLLVLAVWLFVSLVVVCCLLFVVRRWLCSGVLVRCACCLLFVVRCCLLVSFAVCGLSCFAVCALCVFCVLRVVGCVSCPLRVDCLCACCGWLFDGCCFCVGLVLVCRLMSMVLFGRCCLWSVGCCLLIV